MYVLTIPNALRDLYNYPQPMLSTLHEILAKDMFVRLDNPSQVSLYLHDDDKFIVESFRQDPMRAIVLTDKRITKLCDLQIGQLQIVTERAKATEFEMPLNPGSTVSSRRSKTNTEVKPEDFSLRENHDE